MRKKRSKKYTGHRKGCRRCQRCKRWRGTAAFDQSRTRKTKAGKPKLKATCRDCSAELSEIARYQPNSGHAGGKSYLSRNLGLENLGFNSYADYLNSELWTEIRERVFALKGKTCVCGKQATQLHHNRYHVIDLMGITLKHIHPVCRECHVAIEFDEDGNKMKVAEAKKRLTKLRRSHP